MQKKILISSWLVALLFSVSLAADTKSQKAGAKEPQQPIQVTTPGSIQDKENMDKTKPATPTAGFQIPWSSINAGGELNTGSTNYKMKVTTAQSVIGVSQSTNFKMGIGFWYGAEAGPLGPLCTDKPGDANGDSKINLQDIIFKVNYLFKGGPKPSPFCRGDDNADTKINLQDIIYEVNYLFKGGPAPVKSWVCCL